MKFLIIYIKNYIPRIICILLLHCAIRIPIKPFKYYLPADENNPLYFSNVFVD